jgi:hypothetical protein
MTAHYMRRKEDAELKRLSPRWNADYGDPDGAAVDSGCSDGVAALAFWTGDAAMVAVVCGDDVGNVPGGMAG